jgi:hypothetical protein
VYALPGGERRAMSNPMLGTLKAIRADLARIEENTRKEFEHLSTALGDVLRDLDHIKTQVAGRKVGRRVVHRNTKALKP